MITAVSLEVWSNQLPAVIIQATITMSSIATVDSRRTVCSDNAIRINLTRCRRGITVRPRGSRTGSPPGRSYDPGNAAVVDSDQEGLSPLQYEWRKQVRPRHFNLAAHPGELWLGPHLSGLRLGKEF